MPGDESCFSRIALGHRYVLIVAVRCRCSIRGGAQLVELDASMSISWTTWRLTLSDRNPTSGRKRAIIRELLAVTVLPSGKRGRDFDPELIQVDWARPIA